VGEIAYVSDQLLPPENTFSAALAIYELCLDSTLVLLAFVLMACHLHLGCSSLFLTRIPSCITPIKASSSLSLSRASYTSNFTFRESQPWSLHFQRDSI
jgi:hypothetical protein